MQSKKYRTFLIAASVLLMTLELFCQSAAADEKPAVNVAFEVILPGFQKAALRKDAPLQDILFKENNLVITGNHNLWVWNTNRNELKRYPLQKKTKGVFKLRNLGTDGRSLFAASSNTLYQISQAASKTKIMKFRLPHGKNGLTLGFAGTGDDFWWMHTSGILRIDRYGKTLIPTFGPMKLTRKHRIHFDIKSKYLWTAKDNVLTRINLGVRPPTKKIVLRAKNNFRGIGGSTNGVVLHTSRSVLRIDNEGKILQAIPVEGHRGLLKMSHQDEVDSFLFSDRLLEVYDSSTKSVAFHSLPIESTKGIRSLAVQKDYVAVLQRGNVHLYKLTKKPQSKK